MKKDDYMYFYSGNKDKYTGPIALFTKKYEVLSKEEKVKVLNMIIDWCRAEIKELKKNGKGLFILNNINKIFKWKI